MQATRRRMLGSLVGMALLVLSGCGSSADAQGDEETLGSEGSQLTARVPIPATGSYFGVKEYDVAGLEAQLGHSIAVHQTFVDFTAAFPSKTLSADRRAGRIPMISWKGTKLADINSGKYDTMIGQRADFVRDLGYPVFLRWAHEMNGGWFAWGQDPTGYVKAWKRIHGIFASHAANNVSWVWAASSGAGNGTDPKAQFAQYYPGDAYVDWIAVDGYNWGSAVGKWTEFDDIFTKFYDQFSGRGKPLMLAEVGCAEQGGSKAAWVNQARSDMKNRFPKIKAWIHQNYADPKGTNWSVDSSPAALTAYKALVRDPYFEFDGN